MNILHVLDHSLPIHSGYAFRSQEILRALVEAGYNVRVRTGPKHYAQDNQQETNLDIRYQRSPYPNILSARLPVLNQLEVIRTLRRDICKVDAKIPTDVIHAHSPSLNGMAAIWAARKTRIPVVYEMRASWEDAAVDHGTAKPGDLRYRLTQASETWVLKHVNAITTICDGLKAQICERGISENLVTVVPNAVDTERFKPTPELRDGLRQKFDAQGRFVAVFCGSFYSYEGLDLLIETTYKFLSKVPRALVLLAGGGEQEENLKKQVNSRQLSEHVRFLGRVSQDSVIDLYNLADVCVFPRRRMKLTDMVTPLKPLEAMATGALVLASDVGGHRELISDERTGLLFDADDSNALLELMYRTYATGDYSAIRNAAREFVLAERTWAKSASKYKEVYSRVTLKQD